MQQGRIQNVYIRTIGSTVDGDVAAGATDIPVSDASDFTEDGGDSVQINGTNYGVTSVTNGLTEDDQDTIHLDAGLDAAAESGDVVAILPPGQEMKALVDLDDSLDDGTECAVDWGVQSSLAEGVRDPDERESVNVDIVDGEYTVVSINGSLPVLQTVYLDTIHPTDGLPPANTPVLTILPGLNSLFMVWSMLDPSGDPITYKVHLYDAPGTPLDNSNLVAETQGTQFIAQTLADGTPLVAGQTYYGTLIAGDPDGDAEPSAEAEGSPLAPADPAVLADNVAQLEELSTTTIPGIQADLADAASDVTSLQGLFPITSTSISDGAITTPKMTADSINGDRITTNTLNALKIIAGSITTDRMTANTISGDRITANTLNADKIVSQSITAAKIAGLTITAAQIAGQAITATQIAGQTITADQIASQTITAAQIAGQTITAAQIATGTLTATQIAAGSISADKLLIGVGGNSIPNPGLENGTLDPGVPYGTNFSQTVTTNPVHSGSYGARFQCTAAFTGGRIIWSPAGDLSIPNLHLPVSNGDQVHGEFWAMAGAANGQTAQIYCRVMDANGTHLAYGPIQTVTLTAGYQLLQSDFTVTQAGAAYVALTLGSNAAAVGDVIHVDDFVLYKKITGSLIVNGAIDGQTITGAVVQTAASGSRAVLQGDTTGGVIKFYMTSVGDWATAGYINPKITNTTVPSLVIAPPGGTGKIGSTSYTYATIPRIEMRPGGGQSGVTITYTDPHVAITGPAGGQSNNFGPNLIVDGLIYSRAGYNDTTSAASNMFFSSDWHIARSTSLRKAKINIKQMKRDESMAVLDIEPVSFIDRGQWRRNGKSQKGLRRIPGVIAEQVEEVAPLFATYDDDGLNGVSYDRIGPALIPLVRELFERVEALESVH